MTSVTSPPVASPPDPAGPPATSERLQNTMRKQAATGALRAFLWGMATFLGTIVAVIVISSEDMVTS